MRPAPRLALLALALAGCSKDRATGPGPKTAFGRIQREVLTPSCAVSFCHVGGSEYAKQSGLVLEPGVAYRNLVGVAARQEAAAAAGLWRVRPGQPDSSLLYLKLHAQLAAAYGNPMPFGGEPLSVGQLEYIRQWIAAGADERWDGGDTALLADRTPQPTEPFVALDPPAQGYQLHIPAFSVQPAFERELFSYKRVGNPAEIYVNRIETKMRTNSHHFILYSFPATMPPSIVPPYDQLRDIRNADGTMNLFNMRAMAYHIFFGGAMTPYSDYRFPDGVALRLPADASFDLNSHYVNRSAGAVVGEAYANLYTVDASRVQHAARTLFLDNTDITLPARARTTVTRGFTFATRTTVIALSSHMHARGERFVVRIKGGPRDGEIVYTNTDWAHPAFQTFATPLVLQAGEGLTSEVTYYNESDHVVTFGLQSTDEMGIIFGYAY